MILILSGTNRPGSATRHVAGTIHSRYHELGNPAQLLDLASLPLDSFSPLAYAEKPSSLNRFIAPVLGCHGIVFVVPEYNGSFPGVLKYFIDLLPFPAALEHKPVCFVGLADRQWGALRAVEHLQQICLYRNALLHPTRVFIPRIGQVLKSGNLLPEYGERLWQQAEEFARFIERHRGPVPNGISRSS